MQGKIEEAKRVCASAEEQFGITFPTYNVEAVIVKPEADEQTHDPLEGMSCKSIGEFIYQLRRQAKLSQHQLCQGICSISTLSRIENGEIEGHFSHLEIFMQRLGRDINLYINTFPTAADFEEKQQRDKINVLLASRKHDEARALIGELENKKAYQQGVGRQFLLLAKATLVCVSKGPSEAFIEALRNALAITWPDYDERDLDKRRLIYNEINILNQWAGCYIDLGKPYQAARMYERLRVSMNNSYVDVSEKGRCFFVVMYNYSKALGMIKQFGLAIDVITETEVFGKKTGIIRSMTNLAYNKAHDFMETGDEDSAKAYFALAFYGMAMFAAFQHTLCERINELAKKNLGVDFYYTKGQ
jgi:transcriptional regulator with XRE-family HTH domain